MAGRDGGGEVLERLVRALSEHDLNGLVACFANDYVNETPVHPLRGFTGHEQVRRNWTQIFTGVPDLRVELPRQIVDGDTAWTEWDMSGTRRDGQQFLMRGVVIFRIAADLITSARFYVEPVEVTSGDVDAHTARITDHPAEPAAVTS